jgi:hypothetical protein
VAIESENVIEVIVFDMDVAKLKIHLTVPVWVVRCCFPSVDMEVPGWIG